LLVWEIKSSQRFSIDILPFINPKKEYGEERLLVELAAATNSTADEIRDRVITRLREWCAGARQHDDLTLLVLKVK